jgi:hypothetical protein
MTLGNNTKEAISFEWLTAGNEWGKGYGKAKTLETAERKAKRFCRQLERAAGDGVKVPWRVYKRTVQTVFSERIEVALEGRGGNIAEELLQALRNITHPMAGDDALQDALAVIAKVEGGVA